MTRLLLIFILLQVLIFPKVVSATDNQFITIANPVRISKNNPEPEKSLTNQYQLVHQRNLPASWLLTYDALSDSKVVGVIKTFDQNQDIGILLEVTDTSAKDVGVLYNKTDSWHRSTSVFLSGYTQSNRIKLINAVFEKYKQNFGHYPISIGGWWTDAFSLNYIKQHYPVTANLVCSDQLDTDGYSFWGQVWGLPFFPSKNYPAMPADNRNGQLDLVNLQWAPRDPLNGYISPTTSRASLYSTQDYYTINLSDDYLKQLINFYAQKHTNEFGQITFGLEGDFPPDFYKPGSQYDKYMQIAKSFSDTGNFTVTNMKQFSDWFKQSYQTTPNYLIQSDDLLGQNIQTIWYQTKKYRIGLVINRANKTTQIVDLHTYFDNFQDPFYQTPNKQLDLFIKIPKVIDFASNKEDYTLSKTNYLNTEQLQSGYKLNFDQNRYIFLGQNWMEFSGFDNSLPSFIKKSSYIHINNFGNKIKLSVNQNYPAAESGYIFRGLKPEVINFLKQKKVVGMLFALLLLFLAMIILVYRFLPPKKRVILPFLSILLIIPVSFWVIRNSENYFVSQTEIDALLTLKAYPVGKVLILGNSCLQCQYSSKLEPAVFVNRRDYISRLTNDQLVVDNKLLIAHAIGMNSVTNIKREDVKNYLKNLGVNYIYLTKYENYQEAIPYPPGDLGVEQIFVNANAQIYKITP